VNKLRTSVFRCRRRLLYTLLKEEIKYYNWNLQKHNFSALLEMLLF